jgi:spore germination cell wall hydrolase CwlJ-like protein
VRPRTKLRLSDQAPLGRLAERPGWDWLLLTLAICALAAAFVLGAMYRPSPAWSEVARGAELVRLKPGELELMARVVAAEARGESDAGQRAIAWVAINRLDEPETFGRTLTRVLLAPGQFAKPVPIADNSPAYLKAMLATLKAVLGEGGDPSRGSLYFFKTDMRPWPAWAKHMQTRAVIGKHTFMAPVD